MTEREAYIYGWCFGYLAQKVGRVSAISEDTLAKAPLNAAVSFTLLHGQAIQNGVIGEEESGTLANALSEIELTDGLTAHLPMEQQSSWWIGYYRASAGKPLPPNKIDIAARRAAKGFSQQELAEKMGVDQPTISRWEKGKVTPNDENIKKLLNFI